MKRLRKNSKKKKMARNKWKKTLKKKVKMRRIPQWTLIRGSDHRR
jgi:hypothetical protein